MGGYSTNQIDLVVSSSGVSESAEKVVMLAVASERAEAGVGRLKTALRDIGGSSGLGSLLAELAGTSASTQNLSNATLTLVKAQQASNAASVGNVRAQQQESASIKGLIGTKAELREIERAIAQEDKQASTAAKQYLSEEAATRRSLTDDILREAAASAELSAQKNAQVIATERQIAAENQLARAQELAALQSDIKKRSPGIVSNQQSDALAMNEAYDASIAAQIAEQEELTAATEAQAIAQQQLRIEQTQSAASGAQMAMLENEMMNIRREDIVLLDSQTVSSQRLSQATIEQITLTEGLATAETNKASADARLAEINALVSQVTGQQTNVLRTNTTNRIANTAATRGMVSANVSAAAGIGILEGRTLSMNRAAANFVTRILGLGPILQNAFVAIGAIALVAVLFQMGDALYKVIYNAENAGRALAVAFDGVIDPLRKANDTLAVTNDKLDATIAKLEHKPTSNGAALALDQAREMADRLDDSLERVQKDLDKILTKNQVGVLTSILTGTGSTTDTAKYIQQQFDTIDKARQQATSALDSASANKDPKAAQAATVTAYQDERNAILGTITALNVKWNALKKIQDVYDAGPTVVQGLGGNQIVTQVQNQTANLTQLGKSVSLAKEELRGLDETMANLQKTAQVDKLHDYNSELVAGAKAAKLQWASALQSFKDYELNIAKGGAAATAQQKLGWWQDETPKLMTANQPKGRDQELKYQTQVDSQTFGADQLTKMQDQMDALYKYGDAEKATAETDRILQEAQAKHLTLDPQLIANLRSLETFNLSLGKAQKAENEILKEASSAENAHNTMLAAAAIVLEDHPALYDRITQAVNKETEAWKNANDPLRQYNKSIDDQNALMGKYGQELEVETKLQQLQNENIAAGHALNGLQIIDERERLENLSNAQELHNDLAAIYGNEADNLRKLTIQQQAYDQAMQSGQMSGMQYRAASVQNSQAKGDAANHGQGTGLTDLTSPLANYAKQFTDLATSIKNIMNTAFESIANGAANAFAKAIVAGKGLGTALKDVARQGLTEIIAGLIKLGIELLIVTLLSKAFGISLPKSSGDTTAQTAKNAAASIAAIGIVTAAQLASFTLLSAPAWDLAEAVSLASFGANAVSATTGMASVIALGTTQKFANGGYVSGPGGSMSDSIPAFLSNGEYVLNAQTTAAMGGKQQLDALQQGAKSVSSNSPGLSGSSPVGNSNMKVTVEDHTGGVKWQTVQIGHDEMRVIARDEGKKAVYQHSDKAMSQAIGNPNSTTSKQMRQSTNVQRRRIG